MTGADYVRITVERCWLEKGSTVEEDLTKVRTDWMLPRRMTAYSDRDMSELMWSLIARSAFEADGEEDATP